MTDRLMLFRPLTGELIHPGVPWEAGDTTGKLNGYGDVTFTVAPEWHNAIAEDDAPYFMKRGTLAAFVRPNDTIRQVGLVLNPTLTDRLTVICAGHSILPSQSGPWEGHQGYYRTTDPVTLFRRVWEQTQSYPDANLGVRVVGDSRSGSYVGYDGSARYQNALRELNRVKPQLDKAEAHLLNAERVLASREERVFRAAYLKRVGDIIQREEPPEDPGYKADSTLWINNAWRAHRWRDGRWVSQSQADDAVYDWRNAVATRDRARERVEPLRYRVEPLEEALGELEDEGREEYSLYFWQNHDMGQVIEELTELGPFEYREQARLIKTSDGKPGLDLQIEVGAPRVGVRRPELRLELGVNVQDQPPIEHGDLYTGVALFGAGQGSEVLSEQRSLDLEHVVRNIRVETDKDAHTKALTRNAANALLDEVKTMAGMKFSRLTVRHNKVVPDGSFNVGDELPLVGRLSDGTEVDQWVRVLEAKHVVGSKETVLEVEPV